VRLALLVWFFFYQAEDGIRGKLVTGVQTCALPISPRSSPASCARSWRSSTSGRRRLGWISVLMRVLSATAGRRRSRRARRAPARSEERRVGKESRAACSAGRAEEKGTAAAIAWHIW